jgi:hypothetical protein
VLMKEEVEDELTGRWDGICMYCDGSDESKAIQYVHFQRSSDIYITPTLDIG